VLFNLIENCVCYSLGLTTPLVTVSYEISEAKLVFTVSNTFYSLTVKQEEKIFTKHCRFPM
jgi:hypothetical protein